jgi:HD-GYP domain-containing protein (c-di-GMP phosphodiesterase class II)
LLALLGCRDSTDEGHSRRVAGLCRILGEQLRLPAESLNSLENAALWHDLGKLAIRPRVLRQPAKLDAAGQAAVRQHPAWGMSLLQHLLDDDDAALGVLHHHERIDGSGYLGLSGEQVSATARILALAEAWDAMTSSQSFRRALGPDEALARLREERNRWDPTVLAALEGIHDAGFTRAEVGAAP